MLESIPDFNKFKSLKPKLLYKFWKLLLFPSLFDTHKFILDELRFVVLLPYNFFRWVTGNVLFIKSYERKNNIRILPKKNGLYYLKCIQNRNEMEMTVLFSCIHQIFNIQEILNIINSYLGSEKKLQNQMKK